MFKIWKQVAKDYRPTERPKDDMMYDINTWGQIKVVEALRALRAKYNSRPNSKMGANIVFMSRNLCGRNRANEAKNG